MNQINQVFILAAGEGKRMLPLTNTIPKPLAQIKNKAIIDYIIDKISTIKSINKIIINTHHLSPILELHLKSLNNPKIKISSESEKLETGGGLINALPLFDITKPILIINGDVFWQNQNILQKIINSFDKKTTDILLALKPKDQFFGYRGNGDFDFNKTTKEITKTTNPTHNYSYTGIQIIHPKILKNKPPKKAFSLNYFFKKAQKENGILERITGIEIEEEIFHISTMKNLEEINNIL